MCHFERTDVLSFAVSQNQINLTNKLKIKANLRCFREMSKPYLMSLPDLNTVNAVNHKRQFYKHCKCQKHEQQTSRQHDRVGLLGKTEQQA